MSKALKDLDAGKTVEALADLGKALGEPSAVPYAHSVLGVAYLQLGRVSDAIPELEQAVQVLPISPNFSNLGYAHCLIGDTVQGERELWRALELDSSQPTAHYLIGLLLLDNQARSHEACEQLERAQRTLRNAHMALAVCYARLGQEQSVDGQVKEYLGPADDSRIAYWTLWAYWVAAETRPSTAFGFPK
jgi:Flp pilus assembly protein TadD